MVSCSVLNCASNQKKGVTIHRFPRRSASHVLKVWLQVVGKEHLLENPDAARRVLSELFFCELHFSEKQTYKNLNTNRRSLICNAVPDKNIPGEVDGRAELLHEDIVIVASDKMCRLCATDNGSNMISIFAEAGLQHQLHNKLKQHLPFLPISEDDMLPKKICFACAALVISWHQLTETSLRVDEKFKYIIQCHEKETDKSEVENSSIYAENEITRFSKWIQTDSEKSDANRNITNFNEFYLCERTCKNCNTSFNSSNLCKQHKEICIREKIMKNKPENSIVINEKIYEMTKKFKKFSKNDENSLVINEKINERAKKFKKLSENDENSIVINEKIDEEAKKFKKISKNDEKETIQCNICNQLFNYNSQLRIHTLKHTGEKPFECNTCGKKFRLKGMLVRHIREVHDGVKNHKCDLCSKVFGERRFMLEHRRIHTGEKPFICDKCGKGFRQSSSLNTHKRIENNEKYLPCEYCEKMFLKPSELKDHVRKKHTHPNDKDFMCNHCGKMFKDRSVLKEHTSIHSDEKPFVCHICSNAFKLRKYLKQHVKIHTKEFI